MSAKTRENVMKAATQLFAQQGYEGISTRQICAEAGVSANAIHYHFGSKEALYRSVLQSFVDKQLDRTSRILEDGPENQFELQLRLKLYMQDSLAFYIENSNGLRILQAELEYGFSRANDDIADALVDQQRKLTQFFEQAAKNDLLRPNINPAIVAGTLVERMTNQVRNAALLEKFWGTSILNDEYRKKWIEQTLDLCLYGICPKVY